MPQYAFDDEAFDLGFDEAPECDDLITAVVTAYQENDLTAPIRSLLNDTDNSKLCADFDPANVGRPYVIVTQAHSDNDYYAQGLTARVDKIIVSFSVYSDTRKQSVAILNALDTAFGAIDLDPAVGQPLIVDKGTMLDPLHIDSWVGRLNCLYYVQTPE